jgi:adenine-specific DNA-methyltransferase
MKLKHAILETLSRDELKKICSDIDVNDVDQRSIEDMAAKLSRARRATPAVLLAYLSEAQVKEAAEKAGAPTTGRRSVLIAALLEREGKGEGGSLDLSGEVPSPSERAQTGNASLKRAVGTDQTEQNRYANEAVQRPDVGVQDAFQAKRSPRTYGNERPVGTEQTEQYRHANEAVQRPDVGVQDQFQAKKPPKSYRYDSSLDPELSWDEQRERDLGEWLLRLIERAAKEGEKSVFADSQEWKGGGVRVTSTADAVRVLRDISKPFLNWAGKAERHQINVPTVPLFVHERHSTKAILDGIRHRKAKGMSLDLFGDPNMDIRDQLEAYEHKGPWQNRMILGDSLQVMNSMLEYEGLGGQVQMIYIDPPYGVKFGSNFQPFVRNRTVADGDDDMTREPEMVKAYRDTWELGLHSYLTYLRDRAILARDLLRDSGSVFVQISEDNLHFVRNVFDEVFGKDNFIVCIVVKKTGSQRGSLIQSVNDYIVWYARDASSCTSYATKLYSTMSVEEQIDTGFNIVELDSKEDAPLSDLLEADERPIDAFQRILRTRRSARLFASNPLTSGGFRRNQSLKFRYKGRDFDPGIARGSCWKHTVQTDDGSKPGMQRLAEAGRLFVGKNQLRFRRYANDFPFKELTNWWDGLGGAPNPLYVVQTNSEVIARCILMATRPGDLVLDPTCGSGTTAYVAEQWGRRWITIDTSRVPLALARQRLLTATYSFYALKEPKRGPEGGFVYERKTLSDGREVGGLVPHITSSSIANGENPQVETIVNQPTTASNVTRVAGPFVVEATIAPAQSLAEGHAGNSASEAPATHIERMTQVLRQSKTLRLPGNRELVLSGIRRTVDSEYLHAEAKEGDKRIAITFGPQDGAISSSQVFEAVREAYFLKYDQIYFFGFAIEANARGMIEDEKKLRMPAVYVAVTPDVAMSDLLKTTRASEIFSITGLPDFEIRRAKKKGTEGQVLYEIELKGLDIFDPESLDTESLDASNVPCWMVDTDYDGMSFYATQVFFPKTSAWDNLQKSLKATFDESVWEHLGGTTSEPFAVGKHKRVGVKVIDERGNELLRIREVEV